jgi:hypothetical protein
MKYSLLKLFFLTLLFFISDLALSQQIPPIKYADHIDIFNFIDNLSSWHPGITSSAYYEYWRIHHLLKSEDDKNLSIIRNIRKKYYTPPLNQMLGTKSDNEDPIALTFYKSRNYQDALISLKSVLSKEDHLSYTAALESFYDRIQSILSKNDYVKIIISNFNKTTSNQITYQFLEQASSFYHYKPKTININIFIVWRPIEDNDSAFILDNFIILKVPNERKINNLPRNIATLNSIVMHEIMHYFSSGLPQSINNYLELAIKKETGFEKYLSNLIFNFFIEEPLAVIIGQQRYMKYVYPQFYDIYDDVYANAWVRTLSILAQPLVESYLNSNKQIDEHFINKYIVLTRDVLYALHALTSDKTAVHTGSCNDR